VNFFPLLPDCTSSSYRQFDAPTDKETSEASDGVMTSSSSLSTVSFSSSPSPVSSLPLNGPAFAVKNAKSPKVISMCSGVSAQTVDAAISRVSGQKKCTVSGK
jgi:hypothetical protein